MYTSCIIKHKCPVLMVKRQPYIIIVIYKTIQIKTHHGIKVHFIK